MKKLLLAIFAFLISQTAFSGWFWDNGIEHTEFLASKLKETQMPIDPSELKVGWFSTNKKIDDYTIEGTIIDYRGYIRISYVGSIGCNEKPLSVSILSEEESYSLKRPSKIKVHLDFDEDEDEAEAEAKAKAKAYNDKAWIYLESIMEYYVFRCCYRPLSDILYDKGAAIGYNSYLRHDVTIVKEWFDSNKEGALKFLNDFKGTTASKEFSRFLEMFVYDSADFFLVESLCKDKRNNYLAGSPAAVKRQDIYSLWKERKAVN